MKHTFDVSDKCIGCKACVNLAGANFKIDGGNTAYLEKQPETRSEEEQCIKAMEACPVNAISMEDRSSHLVEPILASSNIKDTLDNHPDLKGILMDLSPKFGRIQNPVVYNTMARFGTFKDASRVTGVSLCEILHTINKHLGTEKMLMKMMPDCIGSDEADEQNTGSDIDWMEPEERYVYNYESFDHLMEMIVKLKPQEGVVLISDEEPEELLKVIRGLGYRFNVRSDDKYRLSIFNPDQNEEALPWKNRKDRFDILDVRSMQTDPFDIIIKKAHETEEDSGFILIQTFEPVPLIGMLSEMGYEHLVEERSSDEVWVYLHKKPVKKKDMVRNTNKPSVVIQSATPVAYPVIMRLLQSERLRGAIEIKELKVWEETEKHLAWIANGKADISFSALITSVKLRDNDVKIPALFVWDNFVILTRGYRAEDLKDLKGRTIHTPLFEEAPPAKITKYLISASGLDPDDFNLVYGSPFGRPEKIYSDFVNGEADTVILREPEASYAIKIMQDRGEEISIIPYNRMWNRINVGFGSFPNAGIVLKGEFVRKNPEITRVLLEELKSAIE
ncbi:MAG: ferredoxin, partial [Candidatus Thermoplasmatota archaeon]|nr:ferredoxin [Candidatus Thermoplasmatota archaeon]